MPSTRNIYAERGFSVMGVENFVKHKKKQIARKKMKEFLSAERVAQEEREALLENTEGYSSTWKNIRMQNAAEKLINKDSLNAKERWALRKIADKVNTDPRDVEKYLAIMERSGGTAAKDLRRLVEEKYETIATYNQETGEVKISKWAGIADIAHEVLGHGRYHKELKRVKPTVMERNTFWLARKVVDEPFAYAITANYGKEISKEELREYMKQHYGVWDADTATKYYQILKIAVKRFGPAMAAKMARRLTEYDAVRRELRRKRAKIKDSLEEKTRAMQIQLRMVRKKTPKR